MKQIVISLIVHGFISASKSQIVLMGDETEEFLKKFKAPGNSNLDISAPDDENDVQTIGIPTESGNQSPAFTAGNQVIDPQSNPPLNLNSQLGRGFVINSTPTVMLPTIQGSAPIYVTPGIGTDNYYFNNQQTVYPLDPPYKKKLIQTRNIIQTAQDSTRGNNNFLSANPFPLTVNSNQMMNNLNQNTLLKQNPYNQLYQIPIGGMAYNLGALNGI